MPNYSISTCLELCRRARAESGENLNTVLAELQSGLEHLLHHEQLLNSESILDEPERLPLMTLDMSGYLTGWSGGAEAMFGYTAEEIVGKHVLILYADDEGEIAELFLDQGKQVIEVRRRKKSGEVFWVGLSLTIVYDGDDEAAGLAIYQAEMFDRLSDREKMRLHARIIEDSDQGILITDNDERIVSINSAFTRITGYSPSEAIGQTPDLLRSGYHDASFRAEVGAAMHGRGPWHGEIVGRRKNGELFPQSVTISVVRNENGEITHAFSIFSDISAHKDAEARLQRLANYDTITGLPNRALLDQLVSQALMEARRNNAHGALLVISLNRFDSVSFTLGHEVGNQLLCEVGERLRGSLRDEDILARLEGDKFVVALLHIEKREHAGIVAQKLLSTMNAPVVVDAHELHIDASIGIAVYPEDGSDTASLTRYADVAMTRVQQSGESGFLFYSSEMNLRAKEHMRLEGELRRAMTNGELQLYYQPKVSLRNGRIVGAEALLRWIHPERGIISPGVFIPLAEETGLILDLGNWVFEAACRQIRQWKDENLSMPPIAVNLSARQFDQNLPERLQTTLSKHQVKPEQIKLEITESLLVRGAENITPIMNQLVAMGLALALDDFGTGYSSLGYLKKFPISTLKVDRSFVVGLPHGENDCAIARAIVTMALQLHQEIVAEGVETVEQMVFLRDLGCDQLQGFLFSPAVPSQEFATMVSEGRRLSFDHK